MTESKHMVGDLVVITWGTGNKSFCTTVVEGRKTFNMRALGPVSGRDL